MPKIGCGLDGLSWHAVRTLLKNIFLKENIIITVYSLESESWDTANKSSPKKRKMDSPIENISPPKKTLHVVKTPLLDIFEGKSLTKIVKGK